jgi:hypothetical protein
VQERQFPPSESQELTPAEGATLRRMRARRLQGFTAAAGGTLLLALFALGCPEGADLENPQSFPKPGYSTTTPTGGTSATTGGATTGGSTTGGAPAAGCDTACIKDIFQVQPLLCVLCHNSNAMSPLKSSGLDLKSDGFTARLKNIPAMHTDLAMGMTAADCPTGDKLIDTMNPSASWLLKKIEGQQGACGTPMPSTGALSATQKTCMETYIACVAGGPITGGGGAATGGTAAATGGGGAATGGGGSGGAAAGSGGSGGAKGGSGGSGGT